MAKLFIHGVPDTPDIWTPLLSALELPAGKVFSPALPGFTAPPPAGFAATKEAYVEWLIAEIEDLHAHHGPIDIVGHDWGALLVQRAASLRPELVRTWAVSNALVDPEYKWHDMARKWQTPLLGEFIMSQTRPAMLAKALKDAGLPSDIARHEAAAFTKPTRQCVLKLYRSAKTAGAEWTPGLSNLPERGMVFWGKTDPYVPVATADRFVKRVPVPLHVVDAGHWAIVEKANEFAALLRAHWA